MAFALSHYAHIPKHVQASNLPERVKTPLLETWDQLKTPRGQLVIEQGGGTTMGLGHAVRDIGTSAGIGTLLGLAAHAMGGLDIAGMIPIDGVGSLVCSGLAVASAGTETSTSLRDASKVMMGVYSYRKIQEFLAAKKAAPPPHGSAIHGESSSKEDYEDPVIKAARQNLASYKKTG